MDKDFTHFNLKTFDIVMEPAFSTSSIPITIFPSRQKRRKEKIQNIFKIKNPLNWVDFYFIIIYVMLLLKPQIQNKLFVTF
jgi:hypothetical protein